MNSVADVFELEVHEVVQLTQACRTVDTVEEPLRCLDAARCARWSVQRARPFVSA